MVLGLVSPVLTLTGRAETLKFAWPDGASAKVRARSEGRRAGMGKEITWDMSSDFTMQVRRDGDRVVVSRNDFPGWKGTFPPSFGGGADRFIDMIPTFIVSADGAFIGIEGHETARKLMSQSVEQSGGLDAPSRKVFETISSDAALRAMAADHWTTLIRLWQEVELDPEAVYEFRNATSVPQLGGGELEIVGTVRFVKEAPCASAPGEQRRCAHFRGESSADKAQVVKLIQSLMKGTVAGNPVITDWDQRIDVDIVVDKATMLPQQLTVTRAHALGVSAQGRSQRGSEEMTKTYTFTWLLPDGEQKK
ncbi:MAG TPA: hypothetical protein VFZ44_08045 [Pyrinomonadaceae bacterium]